MPSFALQELLNSYVYINNAQKKFAPNAAGTKRQTYLNNLMVDFCRISLKIKDKSVLNSAQHHCEAFFQAIDQDQACLDLKIPQL